MGWAKYFEDIQKLRDHARSLSVVDIQDRNASRSKAQEELELHKTREAFERWITQLLPQLDEILDHATNPDIDRIMVIEDLEKSLASLVAENAALQESHLDLQIQQKDLNQKISELLTIIDQAEKKRLAAEAALDAANRDRESKALRIQTLEKELDRRNRREADEKSFHNLMSREGIRPIKK